MEAVSGSRRPAQFVVRVGALAVALGVGVRVFEVAGPAIAEAEPALRQQVSNAIEKVVARG